MQDKIYEWIAFKLPRGLVYWCFIRFITYGIKKDQIPNISKYELELNACMGS